MQAAVAAADRRRRRAVVLEALVQAAQLAVVPQPQELVQELELVPVQVQVPGLGQVLV